ncbi:hypothetical protein [Alkalihalobacillus trypoxylicola]|uniref:Uncharacterized protein n=1 Tax=Alkalihalobacillus trypoxylicola TaxID=519424 RepID=A0A162DNR3_9BACI|nr:hypothetical protein [Alkalihalobacillus trypoxylicola]KYG30416.1 hypothetical protein AZF04_19830 [Alkalihalobacillus trypoxylicola]
MLELVPLNFRVTGVDFPYGNGEVSGVRIRFNVTDSIGEINSSGRVSATMEEYATNSDLTALAGLARQKFIERLEFDDVTERAD